MYHSLYIDDKNTWKDWHLVPINRPVVNPPKVKTNYIEVPGADGVLDVSSAFTGQILYSNRQGTWEFRVDPKFMNWTEIYSLIMKDVHGNFVKVILEDDPEYYYEGRLFVNQWLSDKDNSTITIEYNLAPYKKYKLSDRRWIWDTFNFETGLVREYRNIVVNKEHTINVIGDRMSCIPTITVSDDMKLIYENKEYKLSRGVNIIEKIVIKNGENPMKFMGNGIVSIDLLGGIL